MNPGDTSYIKTTPPKQVKRGRGRPRKSQSIKNDIIKTTSKKNTKSIQREDYEDEIILHLPISLKDISNPNKNSQDVFDDNSEPDEFNVNGENSNPDTNIFTINEIHSDSSSNSSNYEVNNVYVYDLKQKIKEQEKSIKKLTKELDEYKSLITEDNKNGTNDRKVHKMNINLFDVHSKKQIVVEKTKIACWWCTYNFDNPPCFLPDNYVDDKFYVFGCFCTFNCAAAYNLNLDDASIWNRYSLLKQLYNLENIIPTPDKRVFTKFGGPKIYEDFKKNSHKCDRAFRLIMPPMASIVPLVEESVIDSTRVSITMNDLKRNAKLKRTKPLPNVKDNLFKCT